MNPLTNPYLQIPDFGEYINRSPGLVKSIIEKRTEVTKKWLPVLGKFFNDFRLSDYVLSDICVYCELCSTYYENIRILGFKPTGNELSGVMDEIVNKITNIDQKRVPVKRKVYNYITGFMEYELEDGSYVKIINESVSGPKIDVSLNIFCEEFTKHLDISLYRDSRIDKLIE